MRKIPILVNSTSQANLVVKLCQNNMCFQLVASMVCPSGLEENLPGQEYGTSAMQGAELNLPADCLGRHHYGHTPQWPGAQHMMGCWEYTAMRPMQEISNETIWLFGIYMKLFSEGSSAQ